VSRLQSLKNWSPKAKWAAVIWAALLLAFVAAALKDSSWVRKTDQLSTAGPIPMRSLIAATPSTGAPFDRRSALIRASEAANKIPEHCVFEQPDNFPGYWVNENMAYFTKEQCEADQKLMEKNPKKYCTEGIYPLLHFSFCEPKKKFKPNPKDKWL
jgi:hypothetical protein